VIGFFPSPYPDELFYSLCSRYHEKVKYKSKQATARDLFGKEQAKIVTDFPSHINTLVDSLPPGHNYTAYRLIYGHTILPFFSPFLPSKRLSEIFGRMCKDDAGGSIHGSTGFLTSKTQLDFLRYCPLCVKEDRVKYRQAYWHRIDQIPGILVCIKHIVFLENSSIHVQTRRNYEAFVTANRAITTLPAVRPLDLSNKDHQIHLRIARDVRWILSNPVCETDLNDLRLRYLGLLLDRQLATYLGVIRQERLLKDFKNFYSNDLLASLQSDLGARSAWLTRLLQSSKTTQHPVHHLLLIQFLGLTAENFFRHPEKVAPFGNGPWPCLNRASEHYKEERIANCEIRDARLRGKELVGTFCCDCGFVYRRKGPDTSIESRCSFYTVLSRGPIWTQKIQELFENTILSLDERAAMLGISRSYLEARFAGIRRGQSESGEVNEAGSGDVNIRTRKKLLAKDHVPDKYREQWLRAVEENPGKGRNEIRGKAGTAYSWLILYDKEWLDKNSPSRLAPSGPNKRIDWQERDARLEKEVEEAKRRFVNNDGRPVRASLTAIATDIGILALISKRPELVPLTIQALKRLSETQEDFAIRRVDWARGTLIKEGKRVKYWDLVARAAVSGKMARNPKVAIALRSSE